MNPQLILKISLAFFIASLCQALASTSPTQEKTYGSQAVPSGTTLFAVQKAPDTESDGTATFHIQPVLGVISGFTQLLFSGMPGGVQNPGDSSYVSTSLPAGGYGQTITTSAAVGVNFASSGSGIHQKFIISGPLVTSSNCSNFAAELYSGSQTSLADGLMGCSGSVIGSAAYGMVLGQCIEANADQTGCFVTVGLDTTTTSIQI